MEFNDEYEPLEEGLDTVVFKRTDVMIVITLSKEAIDTNHIGY
jgi:hypothetical protein